MTPEQDGQNQNDQGQLTDNDPDQVSCRYSGCRFPSAGDHDEAKECGVQRRGEREQHPRP